MNHTSDTDRSILAYGVAVPQTVPDFDDLPEERQTVYLDKAAELLDDLWYCSRAWEAWHVGTMAQHDFYYAAEDDDIVYDTAKTLYDFKEVNP
jgi:hypothetical protein